MVAAEVLRLKPSKRQHRSLVLLEEIFTPTDKRDVRCLVKENII